MAKNKTLAELRKETESNCTFADFPIKQRVEVVTPCEDFTFFYNETGKVIKNTGEYLGITVEFDNPRVLEDGLQYCFNFNPKSLKPINTPKIKVEKEKIKEMTKEDIEKELGYKIKIIKG